VKELRDGDNQRTYERWKKESFNKMNRAKAQSKWKEKKNIFINPLKNEK
jgi:hypothetical protein